MSRLVHRFVALLRSSTPMHAAASWRAFRALWLSLRQASRVPQMYG